MPKPRQRTVFCDCFDCLDRPAPTVDTETALAASTSVARQEPPPKALILYASGFLLSSVGTNNVDDCTWPHLDKAVKDGCLGLLSLRRSQGQEAEGSNIELAQFLGVFQEFVDHGPLMDLVASGKLPTLQQRFKDIDGCFASSSKSARQLALAVGMTLSPNLQLPASSSAPAASSAPHDAAGSRGPSSASAVVLPTPDQYAQQIVAELGPEQGAAGTDLLLVHVDLMDVAAPISAPDLASTERPAQQPKSDQEAPCSSGDYEASLQALEWLDSVVKHLMANTAVRERVLLVVVMTPGPALLCNSQGQHLLQPGGPAIDPSAVVLTPISAAMVGRTGESSAGARAMNGLALLDDAVEDFPLVKRPLQSFEKVGSDPVEVDLGRPSLVIRRLPGVIRRDRAECLGLQEALNKGGQGCILIDRLLPEVAYKVARAPKYGA